MIKILAVGIGSAIGGIFRYLVSLINHGSVIPLHTLVVNFLAAVLIGFFTGVSLNTTSMSDEIKLLLTTGLCGGFSTLSTVSLESKNFIADGNHFLFFFYIFITIVLSLIGIFIGEYLANVVTR